MGLTHDLDACLAPGHKNAERMRAALEGPDASLQLGPEPGDIEVRPNAKLRGEMPVTHCRTRAGDIDILFAIPSGPEGKPLGYCELQSRAVVLRAADARIPVAALDDIVRSKGLRQPR
jgi:hypothetical protein